MVFQIKAITPQGESRWFCLIHDDVELIYQVLPTILHQGETLVEVTMIDVTGSLPLPLDVLEKPVFFNPIEQLRQQWETILLQPVGGDLSESEFKQQFSGLLQDRKAIIRRTLSCTQETLYKAQQHLKQGPQKDRLSKHYQAILDRYSRLLIRLETDIPT